MKLDLLTNGTVVDDAIRFVSEKSKQNLKPPSSSSNEDENESDELDYNEDQLEEQEEDTREMTINQVF